MKLPIISGRELIKILLRNGYFIKNQKGSHVHLWHPEKRPVTVPNHKVISRGTLKQILKETGISREELL